MIYNNHFFKTEAEAKAFKKEHGGVLLKWNPRASFNKKADYLAEVAVAYDARGERIDPSEYPFCVAWNEFPKEG